jgi:predicted Rossmann-fold nucleotide-binding protein
VNGYYDPLMTFIDHALEEGFIGAAHRSLISVEDTPAALLDQLERRRVAVRKRARQKAPDVG